MRVTTYIGYMSLGAFLCAAMPSSARPQTSSANPAAHSQPAATQESSDWQAWDADRAQWQQNMERFRREMRAEAEQLRKQLQDARYSEWAQEAKAMAETSRQKAQDLRAEVEKEMAASGLANRAAMEEMGAQLRANAREYAARAQDEAQQAKQLFEQSPSVLQMGDDTGWLGVEIGEVTADEAKELKLPEARGVVVSDVVDDSPAAKAGLKAKDVIMEYDGAPVEGTVQFRRLVRETPPGRTVNLTVTRDGHDVKLSVQVGDSARNMESRLRMVMPSRPFNFNFTMPEFMPGRTPALGIEAEDLTGQLGEYFHVPGGEGVLIREVNADTPAAKAGLKAGDVITKVDGNAVKSLGELRDNLREKRDEKSVTLTIVRDGAEKSVNVAVEPPPTPHRTLTRSATM
ncbi:MAG TPA: PDZ domain-containing protein [Candidatus Acidoferrales bacterium]|nr:PDZ domain-containing protein [Candidatus Acidoferrales bacterium]